MESQHVLVSAKKSMAPAGLRTIWESFYGESLSTFKRAIDDTTGRYIKVDDITYFNTAIYKKRLHLVIEPFLSMRKQAGRGGWSESVLPCRGAWSGCMAKNIGTSAADA